MTASERFLLVRAGGSRYALPLTHVRRVLRSLRTFPVPGSRPELLGLLQVDGEPAPVLDLATLVKGTEEGGSGAQLTIIVAAGAADSTEIIGLAVHEALSVSTLPQDAVNATEEGLIRGDAVIDDELVRILDPSQMGARERW
jgi:chemotaxis signal transduction protein